MSKKTTTGFKLGFKNPSFFQHKIVKFCEHFAAGKFPGDMAAQEAFLKSVIKLKPPRRDLYILAKEKEMEDALARLDDVRQRAEAYLPEHPAYKIAQTILYKTELAGHYLQLEPPDPVRSGEGGLRLAGLGDGER